MKRTSISIAAAIMLAIMLAVGTVPLNQRALAAGDSPVITYPTENQVVPPGSLNVVWDPVPGADMYSCRIFDLTNNKSGGQWGSFATSTTFTVLAGRTYRISITADFNINTQAQYSSDPSEVTVTVSSFAGGAAPTPVAPEAVTSVSISQTALALKPGETSTLTATVLPSNAADKSVLWSSSNYSVATVSADGVVTAVSEGNALITVTTNDGYKTAYCSVTVTAEKEETDLSKPSYEFGGGKENISAFVGTMAVSSNSNKQNYGTYATPVYSYLAENDNNTFTRFECIDGKIIAEQYDTDLRYLNTIEIPMELTTFGGAYFGKYFNFIVFGQKNPDQSESLEVFRVVKYDKNWNRISSAGLSKCNTTVPFDAGSLRMAEYGDMLYIRSSHEMYKSSDGKNHQANITFSVNIPRMEITDSFSGVFNISNGYVSHSFNQFIQATGGKIAAVDHGDAYPRSIALIIYNAAAGSERFISGGIVYVELMKLAGSVGANTTGASVGGFEVSSSSYLVAGNSIAQDSSYQKHKTRNIFISVTPVNSPSNSNTAVKWLTNYSETGTAFTTTPHLVRINDNNFMVLWSEGETVKYVVVDDRGEKVSEVSAMNGSLSNCKPIVTANHVMWYSTKNTAPAFFEIDVTNPRNPVGLAQKTPDAPQTPETPETPNLPQVPGTPAPQGGIGVMLNGKAVVFSDQQPIIQNGCTLVPIRGVFEQLGFTVSWDESTKTATLKNAYDTVIIPVGKASFTANGKTITPDVPAQIINDRTMLPLRAICESLGSEVNWDEASRTAIIEYGK